MIDQYELYSAVQRYVDDVGALAELPLTADHTPGPVVAEVGGRHVVCLGEEGRWRRLHRHVVQLRSVPALLPLGCHRDEGNQMWNIFMRKVRRFHLQRLYQ
jgi:hypothetical protein